MGKTDYTEIYVQLTVRRNKFLLAKKSILILIVTSFNSYEYTNTTHIQTYV